MKKLKYLLSSALLFTAFSTTLNAATIKETTINNDGYDTIKSGDIVIGITRFEGTSVVTGSKVAKASTNDSKYYFKENKSLDNYKAPTIYVYMGLGGWYSLDDDNNAQAVINSDLLNELENSHIYYVNNKEKKLEIDVKKYDINKDSLPSGVKLENKKLIVNATIDEFKVETSDGIEMLFKKNDEHFVLDDSKYYTLDQKGFITNYSGPKGDIEIRNEINGVKIVGIKTGAFKNKEITSVIIPKSVMTIESNSFDDAKLTKVTVNEKYDSSDFTSLASDAFGSFSNITYNNDITRLLNSYNNELTLNIQKDYKNLGSSRDYIVTTLVRILENKRINYLGDKDGIYVSFEYKNENTLTVKVSKKMASKSEKSVSKDITYTLNKVDGNKTDFENISKAKKEFEDYRSNVKNNFKNNTSLKLATRDKLYEIYGLYDISCEVADYGDVEYFNEGINIVEYDFDYFIIANNILYDVTAIDTQEYAHFDVTTLENTYDSDDEYVSNLLKYFEKETKVTDYEIENISKDKIYSVSTNKGIREYYVSLFDNRNNNKWIIASRTQDKSELYTIDGKGFITGYTGTEKEIKIPYSVNNTSVVGIKTGAFKNKEITSVIIPKSVMTIESNSFDGTKLTKVTVNEKYGSSDFTSLASDAFGSFSNITYNNDITRLLNSYNNELTLNIQKDYKYLGSSREYIVTTLARILENKRINYVGDKDGIYVSFEYKNDNTLTIKVSKKMASKSEKSVSKDITYTLNEVDGNKTDLENISKAKKDFEDYRNNVKNNFKNNTSLKLATRDKLYEIYGLYNISCEIADYGDGEYFNEGINIVESDFEYFIIANNILYDVTAINTQEYAHFGVTTLENTYDSDDEYVSNLLKYFEKETKVTDYKVRKLTSEKNYEVSIDDGVKKYRLIITDSKNGNTWEIVSKIQTK